LRDERRFIQRVRTDGDTSGNDGVPLVALDDALLELTVIRSDIPRPYRRHALQRSRGLLEHRT
jgi:hypothetical protein